jgi:hypothetical protein
MEEVVILAPYLSSLRKQGSSAGYPRLKKEGPAKYCGGNSSGNDIQRPKSTKREKENLKDPKRFTKLFVA